MAYKRGKWKRTLLGIQGIIGHRTAPDWSFLYEVSTIKNSNYDIGDHVELPDGREFIYGKSSGICCTNFSCSFVFTGVQGIEPVVNAQAVGDKVMTVDGDGSHAAIEKDQLRGGYVATWPTANKDQFRGIIGNDASAEGADIKIYLDAPLTVALVAMTTNAEIYQNPYGSLAGPAGGGSSVLAKAGVPAAYVDASGKYFWVQKRGPIFLSIQSDMITNKIGGYYRHDGSIQADQLFTDLEAGNDTTQYAGHRILGNYADNGPLFMLQG